MQIALETMRTVRYAQLPRFTPATRLLQKRATGKTITSSGVNCAIIG